MQGMTVGSGPAGLGLWDNAEEGLDLSGGNMLRQEL